MVLSIEDRHSAGKGETLLGTRLREGTAAEEEQRGLLFWQRVGQLGRITFRL